MGRSKNKRVFILGAGCSANYGYPLGLKLVEELGKFIDDSLLKIPGGCPIIQGAVSTSVDLAAKFPDADTLDKLVSLCEEHLKAFRRNEGGHSVTDAHNKLRTLTDEQILNAKIATVAFFLEKEREARKKTLKGYEEYLLPAVFGRGERWQSAVNASDCSVLTFNYDRLFEIAFLDYFKEFDVKQFSIYEKSVLNSGFNPAMQWGLKRIEIEPDRFCFLKLHGSAGWWANMCPGNRNTMEWRDYCLFPPNVTVDLLQLEHLLGQNKKFEPLIAFPNEKQRFTSPDPGGFIQGPYIDKVWKHAAVMLEKAAEVTVIGYSFAPIDRTYTVENLLCKTPKDTMIKIVNKDIESVQQALECYQCLQDRLKQGRLEFVKKCF